jgi:hypothetical protein
VKRSSAQANATIGHQHQQYCFKISLGKISLQAKQCKGSNNAAQFKWLKHHFTSFYFCGQTDFLRTINKTDFI